MASALVLVLVLAMALASALVWVPKRQQQRSKSSCNHYSRPPHRSSRLQKCSESSPPRERTCHYSKHM